MLHDLKWDSLQLSQGGRGLDFIQYNQTPVAYNQS